MFNPEVLIGVFMICIPLRGCKERERAMPER
jgi:hypothetical protein